MKSKFTVLLFLVLWPYFLFSQYDFGDAPEGALAYPSTGLIGSFPTCKNVPLAGWVQHTNFGAFFLNFDLEQDGNQGLCPSFAPYDNDECFADGDAGIIIPQPFTIVNNQVTPCPQSQGTSLGNTCKIVYWGPDIDINTTNFMPNATPGFFNLIVDWNQNGKWGDTVNCPQGTVPEHAVANFPVPNPFTGPLSLLQPPPFSTGPHTGFFWARFTISEKTVPINWNGEEGFEDGESEDYLIHVGGKDYGDAPEGSLAYPDLAINGDFPSCVAVGGPSSYISHLLGASYFGSTIDNEIEGNNSNCPLFTPNTYDMDECFQDGDAGLIVPSSFTITGPVGNEQVTPCVNPGTSLGTICQVLNWGSDIDINVTGTGYVNVLADWDRDGKWTNAVTSCGANTVNEHVLQNFFISSPSMVPLSSFLPPSFRAGPYHEYVWVRFSISDQQVITVPYWDGSGVFLDGETEDYLLYLADSATSIHRIPSDGIIEMNINPNPLNELSRMSFILPHKGMVRIDILDLRGKIVHTLVDRVMEEGKQDLILNESGFSYSGLANGIYVIRLMVNGNLAGFTKATVIQ